MQINKHMWNLFNNVQLKVSIYRFNLWNNLHIPLQSQLFGPFRQASEIIA
jgi:hypothetical protein